MRKNWKLAIKFLLVLLLIPLLSVKTINATPGRLRGNSIVTINGTYYGQHGSDNHWHKAQKSGGYWMPDGPMIGSLDEIKNPQPSKAGWQKKGNAWYYYNSNGVAQKGWVKVGGTWYYMNSSGVMQTGWTRVGNTWYYMNNSGAMQTGWLRLGSTWYYLNNSGAMQTGWTRVGNTWYYMNNSGVMQTGWLRLGSTWYYLNNSGAMQTGWTRVGSTWYYMNSSGVMQTGWLKVNDNLYYMDASGSMQTGQVNIGGILYYFNSSGVLEKELSDAPTDVPNTPPDEFDNTSFNMVTFNQELLSLINAERSKQGVSPLKYNPEMQKGANIRSYEIDYEYSHIRPNGESYYTAFDYLYGEPTSDGRVSENIAQNRDYDEIRKKVSEGKTTFEKAYADIFYETYRTSSGHYRNMMRSSHTSFASGAHLTSGYVFNSMNFSNK